MKRYSAEGITIANLNPAELANVLCGLRMIQAYRNYRVENFEDEARVIYHEIVFKPDMVMDSGEIEELCQRLNS
jgi:hypothetical protein